MMLLMLLLSFFVLLRTTRLLLQACQLQASHDGVGQRLLCLLDITGIWSCLQAGYSCKRNAALLFATSMLLLTHCQLLLLLLGSHAARCTVCPAESTANAAAKSPSLVTSSTKKPAGGIYPS
jgi:hypothetical protein